MTSDTIHPFERAGLGSAPFRFIGAYEDRGPKRIGNSIIGAPGQPMGTCAFCGTGIAICCQIVSADGKQFIVGSTCVEKTESKGSRLLSDTKRAVNDLARIKREAKAKAERETARTHADRLFDAVSVQLSDNDAIRDIFASRPHPNEYMRAKGLTRLDYCAWIMTNGGNFAKLNLAESIIGLCRASDTMRAEFVAKMIRNGSL